MKSKIIIPIILIISVGLLYLSQHIAGDQATFLAIASGYLWEANKKFPSTKKYIIYVLLIASMLVVHHGLIR